MDIVKTFDNASPQEKAQVMLEEGKCSQSANPPSTEKDMNFDHEDEDNDIMSHLNYSKLQKIKVDFMKQEEGLTLEQFIKVMLIHLPETRDKVGLVKNLIELFR